jgi:hypothetical protein
MVATRRRQAPVDRGVQRLVGAASSTASWPSVRSWTIVAIPRPCTGPDARAWSTSKSRVPWTSGSSGDLVTLPLRRCGESGGWLP